MAYGQIIPNLTINGKPAPYPVLNEREIRATAGVMLAIAVFAFVEGFVLKNVFYIKWTVILFFVDFLIRVIWGTKYSPLSIIGRCIVRKQEPEWVGAIQKRFAWTLGLIMAGTMILLFFVFNVTGPINRAICYICITLLWMESAFGICLGCSMYYGLIKYKIIKEPEYKPACPGGACPIKRP